MGEDTRGVQTVLDKDCGELLEDLVLGLYLQEVRLPEGRRGMAQELPGRAPSLGQREILEGGHAQGLGDVTEPLVALGPSKDPKGGGESPTQGVVRGTEDVLLDHEGGDSVKELVPPQCSVEGSPGVEDHEPVDQAGAAQRAKGLPSSIHAPDSTEGRLGRDGDPALSGGPPHGPVPAEPRVRHPGRTSVEVVDEGQAPPPTASISATAHEGPDDPSLK